MRAAALLLALCALPAFADPWMEAWQSAEQQAELMQNATYLLLRIAGIAWIVIEWIAAIILVRAFYQLRRWARRQETS